MKFSIRYILFRFKGYDYDPEELTQNSPSLDKDAPDLPWKKWNTPITQKRTAIEKSIFNQYVPRGWGEDPLSLTVPEDNPATAKPGEDQEQIINAPTKFKVKHIDKITNFNPSIDTLEIDTDSFNIDSSATFATGKNKKTVKKKLAKRDFDFLYDEKKGGLYFNENGADKGFGDGGIIAILKGAPELTSGNLEFI